MNWTTTPPTKPGFYAWRPTIKDPPNCCDVLNDGTCFLGGVMQRQVVKKIKGEWLRLVPAEEVEKAYREGFQDRNALKAPSFENESFGNSRAKQIAEGTI